MPGRGFRIGHASRIHERAAQLLENQRAPMQPDEPNVVKMDQQATCSPAEERVGVRDDGTTDQRTKISPSRSSPSLPRAWRRRACSRRWQASTEDLRTLRWLPTC